MEQDLQFGHLLDVTRKICFQKKTMSPPPALQLFKGWKRDKILQVPPMTLVIIKVSHLANNVFFPSRPPLSTQLFFIQIQFASILRIKIVLQAAIY